MILEIIPFTMALEKEPPAGLSALRVGDVPAVGLLKEQGAAFAPGKPSRFLFD
ncbi:hypothetical protein [Bradyrhizobium sp. USDA 4506]